MSSSTAIAGSGSTACTTFRTILAYVIQVEENAPELLRKVLRRLPVDVIATGDYQAAEHKFEVSRRMLGVCLELGFPVSVLERSPLVLRKLDALKEINQRTPSVVFVSMISAPDSHTCECVRHMEDLAPRMEKRYAAMEQPAKAGILTGISMISIPAAEAERDAHHARAVRVRREPAGDYPLHGEPRWAVHRGSWHPLCGPNLIGGLA